MFYEKVQCFDSLRVRKVTVEKRRILGTIEVVHDGETEEFRLIFSYDQDISSDENIAGLILTMPLINFSYFAEKLELDFPITQIDGEMLTSFVTINNREVFVNKICRRRYEFFKREYLPGEEDITPENAAGGTRIIASSVKEESGAVVPDMSKTAVLSSGGKESLLTYGMMREAGSHVYPFFFNESGGHWLTAKTAYDEFSRTDGNTMKVWSNVDRFYRFMLRRMKILDPHVMAGKADTYPVRLFIFPVYIFSLLPLAFRHRIGNILLGDEFDDPRELPPFHGIRHYYGVYDQSQDFNDYMSRYLNVKGMRIIQWSAVYAITGSVVERILIERYPDLYVLQRSCHSCRIEDGEVKQCGKCTKCLGVMLSILAARGNPELIGFSRGDVENLVSNKEFRRIRLDPDELNTLLAKSRLGSGTVQDHIDGIHILPWEEGQLSRIPQNYREWIRRLFEKYTDGTFRLDGNNWISL